MKQDAIKTSQSNIKQANSIIDFEKAQIMKQKFIEQRRYTNTVIRL